MDHPDQILRDVLTDDHGCFLGVARKRESTVRTNLRDDGLDVGIFSAFRRDEDGDFLTGRSQPCHEITRIHKHSLVYDDEERMLGHDDT